MKRLLEKNEMMLTIKETANLLGLGVSTLFKKLQTFSIEGIVRENNRVRIHFSSIPDIKKLLNYNDEFDNGTYYSTSEAAKIMEESGITTKRTDINNWIKNGKVDSILHMGYRYIHKKDLHHLIETITNERDIPFGYCTINEASDILGMHPATIRSWVYQGEIESKHIVINHYRKVLVKKDSLQVVKKKMRIKMLSNFTNVDTSSISNNLEKQSTPNIQEPETIASLDGFFLVKDACKILNIKENTLQLLLRNSIFPTAVKVKNKWYIPKEEIISHQEKKELKRKNPFPVTKEAYALDGYISVSEVSKRINIRSPVLCQFIKKGLFPDAIKVNGIWYIPWSDILSSIEDEKESQWDYPSLIKKIHSLNEYLTIFEACQRFNLSRHRIYTTINKGSFPNAQKVNGIWFIPENDILAYHEMKMEKENQRPDGYLKKSEVSKRLNISSSSVYRHINKGTFPNSKKFEGGWFIKESDLNYYHEYNKIKNETKHKSSASKNFELPDGFLTAKDVAEKLNIKYTTVISLIGKGRFEEAKKIGNLWVIPESDLIEYVKQKDENQISITKPDMIHELKQFINSFEQAVHIEETIILYSEFLTTKLNATNGRTNNIRRVFNHLKKLFTDVIINLENEIYDISDSSIEAILANDLFSNPIRELFLKFLKETFLIKGKNFGKEYMFSRKLKRKDRDIDLERYSPDIYYMFEQHVKDIEKHIPLAIKSRQYANMWVLTTILLNNAWRPSDIIFEMPHIDIEVINILETDWFNENRLTPEQCQMVINQLYLKLNSAKVSKTGANLHFLVAPDMVKCLAYACVISELHYRLIQNDILFESEHLLLGTFVKGITASPSTSGTDSHKKFFKDQPDFLPFSSKKLHNSTMTYLFLDITEDDEGSELALETIQWTRSHEDINVTAGYVKLTNKDGSLERVSINLFRRGHFGWLYNYMVKLAFGNLGVHQTLEERTRTIVGLRNEYSPIQLEEWAKSLLNYKNGTESIIKRLYKMSKEQLKKIIFNLYRGQMPSRDGCGQCLSFPDCPFTHRKSCIGCVDFIPQLQQVLIEAKEEFYRLIESLKHANTETILKRDTMFLFNVLLLFNEAADTFGNDIVDGFLPVEERKSKLFSIAERLQLPKVNV